MSEIFLKILNMSLSASWIILAAVLLRFVLRRAPKWINCLLWGIVGLRLVLPFSIESALSLVPSAEPIPHNIAYTQTPVINSGISAVDSVVNPILSDMSPQIVGTRGIIATLTDVAAWVWIAGVALMLAYGVVSYLRLYFKVRPSLILRDNVYYCDGIDTPFILGIIKPRIYIPSGMTGERLEYVLEHERAHLKRGDHFFKPIGFCLLALYWFNPAVWVAYILLCRDIEKACDERVIKDMSDEAKRGYSEALVSCSIHRRRVMACPLAFDEVGVKDRIKSVLSYKKPAFWVIVTALVLSAVLAVCFLTNKTNDSLIESQHSYSTLDGVELELLDIELYGEDAHIDVKWKNKSLKDIIFGEEFYIYRLVGDEWVECKRDGEYYWFEIAYCITPLGNMDMTYRIGDLKLTSPGKYRFESECTVGGEKGKVYLAFELSEPDVTLDDIVEQKNYTIVDQRMRMIELSVPIDALPEDIYSQKGHDFAPLEVVAYKDYTTTVYLKHIQYANEGDDKLYFAFDIEHKLFPFGNFLSVYKYEGDNMTSTGVGRPKGILRDAEGSYENAVALRGYGPAQQLWFYVDTDVLRAAKEYASFTVSLNMVTYTPKDFDGTVEIKVYDEPYPDAYDKIDGTIYICTDTPERGIKPSITLYNDSNRYTFCLGSLSSYIADGRYELTDDRLLLTTDDEYKNKYVFLKSGDGYIFVAEESSKIPKYIYSENGEPMPSVPDGALFKRVEAITNT